MSTTVLYTPEVLALATGLARHRWNADLPMQAEVRSKACGSTIALALSLATDGTIDQIGVRSQACAIGQAAAAIFADAAPGMTSQQVRDGAARIAQWLSGEGDLPDWPGLSAIAAARAYPGRHGALMLPWNAGLQALSSDDMPR